jgi:hypothetical protein
MRRSFRLRFAWSLGLLSVLGCSELVSLGTVCPEGNGICAVPEDAALLPADVGPLPADGGVAVPVAEAGADVNDAGQGPQLAPDADVPVVEPLVAFPQLRNGDFALTNGAPGDVTYLSVPTATLIAPWFTCQPIGAGDGIATAVRAESSVTLADSETPPGAMVGAPDGSETFVSIRHLVTLVDLPLVQRLAEPLRQGQRYAIAVDVRTGNTDALLSLQLRGGNADLCLSTSSQSVLAETDPITQVGWQTVCLPFVAPLDYTHLILSVKSELLRDARLFFDHMRPATARECPAL